MDRARRVRRFARFIGSVVGWLPATLDDPALWHIRHHEDNDEEDLEEDEVRDALELWSELLMQQAASSNTGYADQESVCDRTCTAATVWLQHCGCRFTGTAHGSTER